MKYAVFVPVLGKDGEKWIFLFDKTGAVLKFDTKEEAEAKASEYRHSRVVEYK